MYPKAIVGYPPKSFSKVENLLFIHPRMVSTEEPDSNTSMPQPYKLKQTLTCHKCSIFSVKFSDDGKLIATSFDDKTTRTWSTSDGSILQEFIGHEQGISDVAFSSDTRYLATASDDKTVRLWDISNGSLVKTLTGHTNYVFVLTTTLNRT